MAATSYNPQVFHPKYGQTGKVRPPTANHGLPFEVRWPNLELKVSIIVLLASPNYVLISRVSSPLNKNIFLKNDFASGEVNKFINKGQGLSP